MRPKAFGIVHGDQDELAKQINQYQDHVLTDDDEVRQQAINHRRSLANEGLSE